MLNPETIRNLLLMFFGFVVIATGIGIAASAKKAKMQDVAQTSVVMIVAIIFVGLGAGAIGWAAFGQRILTTFGITTG